jgi:putative transposase
MPRVQRVDVGGEVYHVLNRANARVQIFDNDEDYQQFEQILEEAIDKWGHDKWGQPLFMIQSAYA